MKHIITILAEGFEEVEAVTFIDLLRRANIKVTILGLDTLEVTGSHKIKILCESLLKNFSGTYDGIVLPGGQPGTTNLGNSDEVIRRVKESNSKELLCASICAAPSVFGKSGILEGIRATCFPGVEDSLTGAIYSESAVLRDKNIITSRGVGTAIPFALELISYLLDDDTALKIRSSILYQS